MNCASGSMANSRSLWRMTPAISTSRARFRSGKTTAALWKVFKSCEAHPGIQWLLCRYGDGDTQSKLKPAWRAICDQAQVTPTWDPHASCDTLPNGSKAYLFGLKSADQV